MTRKPSPTSEEARDVEGLSFRQAREKYRISYDTWRRIKDGKLIGWKPYRGGGVPEADVQDILADVRARPGESTPVRARRLRRRTETLQSILKGQGLNRLTARLRFAGYQVEDMPALARARQRRILAAGPGAYTCIDFKRFGALSRHDGRVGHTPSRWVSGCVVVDQYSGFASVYVCEEQDKWSAATALERYCKTAPFKVAGIVLSDNALCFLSSEFEAFCATGRLVHRTTQYNHPWSNGKVEALNRTLKYQCMPALAGAGFRSHPEAQGFLDRWMEYYNGRRAHMGWINKGLPPKAVIDQWEATPGDAIKRLVALGHIRPADMGRVRVMGANERTSFDLLHYKGTPFAFVIEAPPAEPRQLPPGFTLQK
ncbi:MAG: integrase core domain-containing protein [Candidatus Rokuibacteriota bacterium]